MHELTEDWAKAQVDFFESFKSYDEAGSPQRIQVLKYLVLAHMLMDSQINPFDSQETKPFVFLPSFTLYSPSGPRETYGSSFSCTGTRMIHRLWR